MVVLSDRRKQELVNQAKQYKSWSIEELKLEQITLSDQVEELAVAFQFNPENENLEFKLRCFQYMKKALDQTLLRRVHGGTIEGLANKNKKLKRHIKNLNEIIAKQAEKRRELGEKINKLEKQPSKQGE